MSRVRQLRDGSVWIRLPLVYNSDASDTLEELGVAPPRESEFIIKKWVRVSTHAHGGQFNEVLAFGPFVGDSEVRDDLTLVYLVYDRNYILAMTEDEFWELLQAAQ